MTKRFSIVGCLIALLALGGFRYLCYQHWHRKANSQPPAPGDRPALDITAGPLTADEIQLRVAAVFERASPALARIEDKNGRVFDAGVIVTADGYMLYRAISGSEKPTFRLSDHRSATGTVLGRSQEWGISLVKLDGPGPWPHVELADSDGFKAGQCVITLGYSVPGSEQLFSQPLLDVKEVSEAAPHRWFVVRDEKTTRWRNAPAVFDLEGRLVGVGWLRYVYAGFGTIYTDAKVIRSLWNDLLASKNLDELRLRDPVRGEDTVPPMNKAIPPDVEKKAAAASVRIRMHPKDRGFSGTIVSADGLVVTCAHAFQDYEMPGTRTIVCLPDGQDAVAVVVGYNPLCDVGLVQITDKGPWPHVEMGNSVRLRPGDPCLFAGYGPQDFLDRQPLMRRSSVAAPPSAEWSHLLGTDSKVPFVGGDSGGGVFDVHGRLVALHEGIRHGETPHTNPRVELVRLHWDELHQWYEKPEASALEAAGADHRRAAEATRGTLVDMLDGKRIVAHGTVVGRDGRILTLANVLPEAPTCRLSDGRVLPATVVKTSREHNLAILKIEAADLPALEWSEADAPPIAALVALAAQVRPAATGFVSHPMVSIPAERGALWVQVQDQAHGLEVADVLQMAGPSLLRKGDIILSIRDHLTPNTEAYRKLWQRDKRALVAGDWVRVVVSREGKKVELRQMLSPPNWPRPEGESLRSAGFASVYGVAMNSESILGGAFLDRSEAMNSESMLGGPVLDRTGRGIGIAIAWRARGWLLVVPAAVAKGVLGFRNGRM
jgi:serine protease Do